MVCIYCGSATRVNNSRLQRHANQVWRRRECLSCGGIFTAIERPEFSTALLVQENKKLTPFSRDRLFISLHKSCEHRRQPTEDAGFLTQVVMAKLTKHQQSASVTRDTIVELAIETLQRFDPAAATIYAAYHPLKTK